MLIRLWNKVEGGEKDKKTFFTDTVIFENGNRDPKIGDISHKYNTVVHMKFVAGIAVTPIICIALLLPGGVSKTVGGSLIVEEGFEVSEPKSLIVSEPKSIKVSKPKSLESGSFLKGKYTPAKRENPAYRRCATLEGFSARQQCALEALGITQEDVN